MGRTKRRRLKKLVQENNYLCNDEVIINLQKWMSKNCWKNNAKLRIKPFLNTGRGISSKHSISTNDVLISIPIHLMITYSTIKIHFLGDEKLTMHELLSVFLIAEKMRGTDSNWFEYIQSMPENLPFLPWLATAEEINVFPSDLRVITTKATANFQTFLHKIHRLMDCVTEDSLCKWAYIMVNTRAVYIDPNHFHNVFIEDFLLDEPSMALCPFLDMFNHHYLANTEAHLVTHKDTMFYELRCSKGFKKNEQIYISYGPHDNIKLLMEYGFFIPGNLYDIVTFNFQEVSSVLKFSFDHNRYKFITDHNFTKDLYIGYEGVSYNLKIVLFIGVCQEYRRLDSIVFCDKYPIDFLTSTLPSCVTSLLEYKRNVFQDDLRTLENGIVISDSAKNVIEFVKYRIIFVENLKTNFKIPNCF